MTKNFKKEILEKIKAGKIDQKSKWYFLTKSYVFWFFSGLSTIFGGIAFAAILLQIKENNEAFILPPEIYKIAGGFLGALPFWWVLAFLVFLIIGYLNYKNTYKSYARERIFIIAMSLALSVILGFTIFFNGFAKEIEHKAQGAFPEYKKHLEQRKKRIKSFLIKNGYTKKDLRSDPELREKIKQKVENRVKRQKKSRDKKQNI